MKVKAVKVVQLKLWVILRPALNNAVLFWSNLKYISLCLKCWLMAFWGLDISNFDLYDVILGGGLPDMIEWNSHCYCYCVCFIKACIFSSVKLLHSSNLLKACSHWQRRPGSYLKDGCWLFSHRCKNTIRLCLLQSVGPDTSVKQLPQKWKLPTGQIKPPAHPYTHTHLSLTRPHPATFNPPRNTQA